MRNQRGSQRESGRSQQMGAQGNGGHGAGGRTALVHFAPLTFIDAVTAAMLLPLGGHLLHVGSVVRGEVDEGIVGQSQLF